MATLEALADHGADINAREARWGQTPLMFAASRNRVPAIDALVARGAGVGITSKVVLFQDLADRERLTAAVRDSVLEIYRARSPDPGDLGADAGPDSGSVAGRARP